MKNLKIGDKVVAYAVSFLLPFSCFIQPAASPLIRAYSELIFRSVWFFIFCALLLLTFFVLLHMKLCVEQCIFAPSLISVWLRISSHSLYLKNLTVIF